MKPFHILLALCLATLTTFAEKANVIILTGANNHNWKTTTSALQEILQGSDQFTVDVVTAPETLPEKLEDADVLLSNWNGFGKNKPAPWSDSLKTAYVDFVRKGGGHVVVHAGSSSSSSSSSSFYDWGDYQAICCATWKNGTRHKAPHEFEVRISNPKHPIFQGLENFKTIDELWFKPFVHPNAQVIAESFSEHTGNWEPTAFVS